MAVSHRDFTSGHDLVVHEVQGLFTSLRFAYSENVFSY
jgi:hypothetical protein